MVFEDIAEVQMSTSTFSAQYGVGGAVFNQISKSGTNAFHGALYEYLQNNFFNARNIFSSSVPVLRYHNFGGAIGGPVFKNRAFFFFNVDKIINNTTSFYSNSYPTSDQRAGVFSGIPNAPTIYDPATLGQGAGGKRLPFAGQHDSRHPARPARPILPDPVPDAEPLRLYQQLGWVLCRSPAPFLKYFGRFDYNISDKNRLTLSVTQRDNPGASLTPDAPLDQTKSDIDELQRADFRRMDDDSQHRKRVPVWVHAPGQQLCARHSRLGPSRQTRLEL